MNSLCRKGLGFSYSIILRIVIGLFVIRAEGASDDEFSEYYSYLWGGDHFSLSPQGTQVQLKIDPSSGAGFRSKAEYRSGHFHIRMKIPHPKTGGIVTTLYLTSAPDNEDPAGNHFEIDYEFIGTNGTLQTNVYDDDSGHREQSFSLPFDPSLHFHSYDFIWNSHQIIFMMDGTPIRVFKNYKDRGVAYPDRPMHIEASIWNADWAGVVDWTRGPFIADYSDFGFDACPAQNSDCDSSRYKWNGPAYTRLSGHHKAQMASFRRKYMTYDYCSDPSSTKIECSF